MSAVKLPELRSATMEFFRLHWPHEIWNHPPDWSAPWHLRGTMPGTDKQGIYALLDQNGNAIYVGVGAAFGGGIYEGCGLGARTARYFRVKKDQKAIAVNERCYEPSKEWQGRDFVAITTLSVERDQAYLAYGLEAFLLSRFETLLFNKVRSARQRNV
jgi:hypothetical protein